MLASLRRIMPSLIISSLLGLFVFVYFIPEIFITVYSGEAGVLYRRFFGGTVTDKVYGEGLHLILPWDEMFVYNVRVQEVEKEISVLTKSGLRADITISIRYHPEYDFTGVLHKRVGPDYAEKIVVPEVVSSLRTTIGQYTAEELYTTSHTLLTKTIVDSLEEVANNYVVINDVIIRRIDLPEIVQTAIQEKLQQKHIAESFVFRIEREKLEAQRKEIEATGYQKYNDIVNRSLTADILKWKGIEATRELATSDNAKVIVVGTGPDGLPIILGADR